MASIWYSTVLRYIYRKVKYYFLIKNILTFFPLQISIFSSNCGLFRSSLKNHCCIYVLENTWFDPLFLCLNTHNTPSHISYMFKLYEASLPLPRKYTSVKDNKMSMMFSIFLSLFEPFGVLFNFRRKVGFWSVWRRDRFLHIFSYF